MKAAICREFSAPLSIEEIELRDPIGDEVLVKMEVCAICHSDIHCIDGAWGGALPVVFGHEAAGIIEAVGNEVEKYKPGDRVSVTLIRFCGQCYMCHHGETQLCSHRSPLETDSPLRDTAGETIKQGLQTGAFAEKVLVESSQIVKIPDHVPIEVASLLSCGVITGFGAVRNTAKVKAGASVAIIGTGGVGLNAVQGARILGADPIIAVDLSTDKLEAALQFGATHVINAGSEDVRKTIKSFTGGRGADYCFIAVGSAQAIAQAMRLVRPGGKIVIVGIPPSDALIDFNPCGFATFGQTLLGSYMGSSVIAEDIPYLIDLYEKGELMLDELISHHFEFADINRALETTKMGEGLRNIVTF